jgi:hypothetical protein
LSACASSPSASGVGQVAAADHLAVMQLANALDRAVDAKDWAAARALFAEQVTADLGTGQAQPMTGDAIVDLWSANLGPKKTSFHLRGTQVVKVDGDTAVIDSSAYAWNRMEGNGDPLWEVWGDYRHEARREAGVWRITGFAFKPTHERGNMWVKTTPG